MKSPTPITQTAFRARNDMRFRNSVAQVSTWSCQPGKRRLILIVAMALACLGTPRHLLAQGQVTFYNSLDPITTNDLHGTTGGIVHGEYIFGLYLGTNLTSLQNSTTPVLVVTNNGFPGNLNAGVFTVPGYAPDTVYQFQVKGWSLAGGAVSYETALLNDPGGYFGVSQFGTVSLSRFPRPDATLFGPNPGNVPGFVLTPLPEPSTLEFAGLAGGGLLVWRRLKRECVHKPGK